VAAEVWTKIQFNTANYNDSSLYNTATHRWTPPSGRCQIVAAVNFSSGPLLGTPVKIAIYKNGTLIRQVNNACVTTDDAAATITVIEACNGSDYFEVFAFIFTSTTGSILGSQTLTYFMGTTL